MPHKYGRNSTNATQSVNARQMWAKQYKCHTIGEGHTSGECHKTIGKTPHMPSAMQSMNGLKISVRLKCSIRYGMHKWIIDTKMISNRDYAKHSRNVHVYYVLLRLRWLVWCTECFYYFDTVVTESIRLCCHIWVINPQIIYPTTFCLHTSITIGKGIHICIHLK